MMTDNERETSNTIARVTADTIVKRKTRCISFFI